MVTVTFAASLFALLPVVNGAAADEGDPGAAPPPAGTPAPPAPASNSGYDISYPQCPADFPSDGGFGVIGVTNGLPWSANPCLAAEYSWATSKPSPAAFYMNTANPGPISSHWQLAGPRACVDPSSYADTGCAYNYGWNAADQAFAAAAAAAGAANASSHAWWLDIETGNSWNGSIDANSAAIQGYLDYLLNYRAVPSAGVYSTGYQWGVITGGYQLPTTPNWVAGAPDAGSAPGYCSSTFTGGPVRMVQFPAGSYDGDITCP
ncbi:MAG: hypothetical protein NVSMB17_13780 [Candidatus Dormibacteria bacterium]